MNERSCQKQHCPPDGEAPHCRSILIRAPADSERRITSDESLLEFQARRSYTRAGKHGGYMTLPQTPVAGPWRRLCFDRCRGLRLNITTSPFSWLPSSTSGRCSSTVRIRRFTAPVSLARQRPRNTQWPLSVPTFTTKSTKNCRFFRRLRGCRPLPTIGSSGVDPAFRRL